MTATAQQQAPTPADVWAPPDPSRVPPQGRDRVRPRRPTPAPVPLTGTVLGVVVSLIVLLAAAGWAVLQVLGLSAVSQTRAQAVLYAQLRQQLAEQTAPLGGSIAPGSPVALLSVPTLGLQQVVVEGTASGDLQAGPGHRRNTVLPGQVGTSIVYGRSVTYGAPFRQITTLQAGDGIQVTTAQGAFTYRVDDVRRAGDPLPAALAAGGARLILVTSEGHGAFASIAPTSTVYVDATLQGTPAGGQSGRPSAVPASELPFGTDDGSLALLALWLALLVAGTIGAVTLRGRVPTGVLWMLATPVIVAFAWLAVDAFVWSLPNLV